MLRLRVLSPLLFALALALPSAAAAQSSSFVLFESGPVRPLTLSPDGNLLVACNTPNGRLEVFATTPEGLTHLSSVAVGMEPVAVSVREGSAGPEAWVVNHLSDSVSIVDLSAPANPSVRRTLLVGDEPRDVVFAGSPERAFVTTAHRGQHRTHPTLSGVPGAGDPQLTTPGVGRADVWVFDAEDLDQGGPTSVGGIPVEIVDFFGDTPRPLAVSPDGSTVYTGVFKSGNQTTTVSEGAVCDGFESAGPCTVDDGITSPGGLSGGQLPGGNPGPSSNFENIQAPEVGLIVEFDEADGEWQDELGRNWSNGVRFHLPDRDVFALDADTLAQVGSYQHVGTTLFNMAVNPVNGNLYVTNTESKNLTRFEGPGIEGGSTVQGNLAQTRVTVVSDPLGASQVAPRHLNRHIDYSQLPAPAGTKQHSLSTPLDTVVSSDGTTLYLAAFGSQKVGVLDTADLEDGSQWTGSGGFDPTAESADDIALSGGGPAGLALDEANQRLYVLTRFNNAVSIVDLANGTEQASIPITNPEPASVVEGRPMLYDAVKTSSNGEASCASCHIFGDKDELAWDLGDPDAPVTADPIPNEVPDFAIPDVNGGAENDEFHPMKGPMTTQTLKGLQNHGGMHWRGDRTNGFFGIDDPYAADAELSFNNFIVAFEGLVGDDVPATDSQRQADMQEFTDFALQMMLPPNPVRSLDNQLNAAQQSGLDFYMNTTSDTIATCNGCHSLDASQGFFGTGGTSSFENEPQIVKIPHLRNLYTKVGMFGMPDVAFVNGGESHEHQGDQVRGFGFLHDGSTDTLTRFLSATVFNFPDDQTREDVEQLLLAFDSDLAPVVGQQVTDDGSPLAQIPDVIDRRDLLKQRAGAAFTSKALGGSVTECDLVVRAFDGAERRGWLYDPQAGTYLPDRGGEPAWTQSEIDALAGAGTPVTYTCAPPGSGERMAFDEDEDGVLDGDERDAGTDPANAGSLAGACADGIDNDGDGLTDLSDAGCKDASWDVENPECSDGVNNDNDGLADFDGAGLGDPDPQCPQAFVKRERGNGRCGLGFEVVPALGLLALLRRRRRRS